MKFIRLLLKMGLSILLLLILTIGVIYLFPSAQTAIARQFIPADPGVTPRLDRLKIGLSRVDASGFSTTLANIPISLEKASIEIPLWGLLGSKVHVQSATVEGIKVDLSQQVQGSASSAEAPSKTRDPQSPSEPTRKRDSTGYRKPEEPEKPFRGFLSAFQWPANMIVDEWQVDAEVTLEEGTTLSTKLSGKDLKNEGKGQLLYEIRYLTKNREAFLSRGDAEGALKWEIDKEGFFTKIFGLNKFLASGPDFKKPVQLELYLEAKPIESGDTLLLEISSADLPQGTPHPLVVNARYLANQDTLEGTFAALFNLADFRDHLPEDLRDLTASLEGTGDFNYSPGKKTGTFISEGKLKATELHRFQESIPEFAKNLDMGWSLSTHILPSEELQVDTFHFEALFPLTGTRFSIRPSAKLTIPFTESEDLLSRRLPPIQLAFEEVSPSLIRPFLPEGIQLGFQPIRGEIDITLSSLESIAVTSAQPILLNQLQLRGEGIPQLAPLNITFKPDIHYSPKQIQLAWSLQTAPAGNTPNALGVQLQWDGKGALEGERFSLEHTLNGNLTQLQQLVPQLPAGQSATLYSRANLQGETTREGTQIRIQSFENRIGQGNQAWLTLSSAAPWSLRTREGHPMPELEGLHLNFLIQNLPLQLVSAFVPGLEMSAVSSGGSFQLRSQGKGWVLQNQTPLTLQGFTLSKEGEPMLRQINLSANLNGSLDAQEQLSLQLPSLILSAQGGNLLSLQGNFKTLSADSQTGEIPWEVDLSSEANLALLKQQPLLQNILGNLREGRSKITVKGKYQKKIDLQASIEIQGLRGIEQTTPPQSLSSTLSLQLDPASRSGTVQLPLTLSNGIRASKAELKGSLTTPGENQKPGILNAKLIGNTLFLEDFLTLASTWTPPVQSASPTPARPTLTTPSSPSPRAQSTHTPPAPDTVPPWEGWLANIEVQADRLILPNQTVVDQLVGQLSVTERRAALEQFKGRIQGAPAELQLGVDFTPGSPNPYQAKGFLDVQNLETAGFFPDASNPPLSTKVRASGNLSGNGLTISDTIEKLQGHLEVEAHDGIFRAFSTNPFLDSVTSALGGLGQLILGEIKGLPPELRALERLSSILSAIPFQQMRFEVVRGEDLNIQVRELRLTGNEVQLAGQGLIRYQPNTPVLQQPLNLNFQLATRGETANVFQSAKLIKPLQEGMSNQQFRGFDLPPELTGSLGNINSDQVWKEISDRVWASLNLGGSSKSTPEGQPSNGSSKKDPIGGILRGILK